MSPTTAPIDEPATLTILCPRCFGPDDADGGGSPVAPADRTVRGMRPAAHGLVTTVTSGRERGLEIR